MGHNAALGGAVFLSENFHGRGAFENIGKGGRSYYIEKSQFLRIKKNFSGGGSAPP